MSGYAFNVDKLQFRSHRAEELGEQRNLRLQPL